MRLPGIIPVAYEYVEEWPYVMVGHSFTDGPKRFTLGSAVFCYLFLGQVLHASYRYRYSDQVVTWFLSYSYCL